MFHPESYSIAILLMILSMICWGSWANALKFTPRWPFQLFYWDYAAGVLLASLLWGITAGNIHPGPTSFFSDLHSADTRHWLLALLGGAIFNLANILLVAAIEIAGLAVAFPLGIGLALVVGVGINYLIAPKGSPILLFAGVALVVIAIVVDSVAYKRRDSEKKSSSSRGIWLSVVCGLLMGSFYPLVASAGSGGNGFRPYAVVFVFSIGVAISTIPINSILMRKPLTVSPPVSFKEFFASPLKYHLLGIIGGAVWCTGAVASFVAAHAQVVGPAVSYAIGQGATMISAFWGVVVWGEFAEAPKRARSLLPLMLALFIFGIVTIAIAPLFS